MKLFDTAIQAALDKDFAKLEDLWTEMVIDESIGLASFFEVCDELKKVRASERALPLLEMLAEQHMSNKTYTKALEVYKKMLYFSKQDTELRVRIIDLYRKLFPESTHFNEYLDISGLNNNDPIFKAIAKLDEFLKYDVGKYFYFERYGFGEVIDTIPAKKEIIIDFEKKKRHFGKPWTTDKDNAQEFFRTFKYITNQAAPGWHRRKKAARQVVGKNAKKT
jgi:transcription elongation factor GreA-like protein